MATYEEIYGKRVEVLSSDPTLSSAYEGQVWYNSTTGTLKTVVSFGAWASASNLNQAIYDNTGAGIQDAALNVGGTESPSVARSDNTEEYNGSGWATSGNLNTARFALGGLGTQTAAIVAGGNTSPGGGTTAATESYNGSVWTSLSSPSNLNTPRQLMNAASMGTSTAGLMVGGTPPTTGASEEWGGSSWANGGTMSTARYSAAAMGTQTAALAAGGETPYKANVEEYNGASWTTGTNLPTATSNAYRVGNSTTDLYVAGGYTPSATTTTHQWNGTAWSTAGSMGRTASGSGGSSGSFSPTAGLAFGGSTPSPSTTTTEEFNYGINTVTGAAWATGGALNTARNGLGASGTQTAGLAAGGNTGPSKINNSEEYNGTSWTEGENLNTARGELAAAGNSPPTASLVFGGTTSSAPDNPGITNASEEYNGTSWSSENNLNFSSRNLGGLGVQDSAVAAGGLGPPTYLATTGEYNGTNWTAGTSLPAGLQDNQGMTGVSQTVGLLAGGEGPPGAATTATLEYNGTSWTAGGSLPTSVYGNGAAGIQTAALSFGGNSDKTAAQGYDGTAWSTRPSLATGRNRVGGLGTNTAALAVGGLTNPGAVQTLTEEFTETTETVAAKTLTTS